ncbi:MAG: hypothetical protein HXY49_03215 [Ignavibacteriaceae bacterium]|nr:hypothetical protein [Ignavibacteriaceae bacterium]
MLTILFNASPDFSFGQSFYLGIGGGITKITKPENLITQISKGGAGFKKDYHFGLKGKFGVSSLSFSPIAYVNYHSFSSEEKTDNISVESIWNILSFGAGLEYNFLTGPITPYLTADLSYNNFGELKITRDGSSYAEGQKSRYGMSGGAGIDLKFLSLLSIDLVAKYNFFNFFGKHSDEKNLEVLTFSAYVLFSAL